MRLHFTKMQGAGNDFVVLDGIRQTLRLTPERLRRLADRRFGVGADQVLVVERPDDLTQADFKYRIFNRDGGEVEHCGNGARCFVKFVRDVGLTQKRSVRVQVARGLLTLTMRDDGEVIVDMGAPRFEPAALPCVTEGLQSRAEGADQLWPIALGDATAWVSLVSMGNPHAVQRVDDVEHWPVAEQGAKLESHARFPQRVNAGFMELIDPHQIRLRVYERGAGETLTCGTGACAAVVAGIRRGLLVSPVGVHTHGGRLTIFWDGAARRDAPVIMAGPAVSVFEGEIDLADASLYPPAP